MGIFDNDKPLKPEKVKKELARLLEIIQGYKRAISYVEEEIKEIQRRCQHTTLYDYDYDPRFVPKKICGDCGVEV